jgi:hypothetical protein
MGRDGKPRVVHTVYGSLLTGRRLLHRQHSMRGVWSDNVLGLYQTGRIEAAESTAPSMEDDGIAFPYGSGCIFLYSIFGR